MEFKSNESWRWNGVFWVFSFNNEFNIEVEGVIYVIEF